MKISLISYKIASCTLVLGGIIHTLSEVLAPETPERIEIIKKMETLNSQILGTNFNMFLFFQGFSFMMGLLLFGYGLLNLFILKNIQQEEIPLNILITNTAITFTAVILSVKYFFIIPILLTSIPFLGYLISLITKNQKQ